MGMIQVLLGAERPEYMYYVFLHGCYPIYPVSDRSIRLDPIRLDAVT